MGIVLITGVALANERELERCGDAPGAVEALDPVARLHALDANLCTRFGCVDKTSIAQINTHMGIGMIERVVEDEITRLEFCVLDAQAQFALRLGIVR